MLLSRSSLVTLAHSPGFALCSLVDRQFVDDGICDCCDGSDDLGTVSCPDTCVEEGRSKMVELQSSLADAEAGLRKKDVLLKAASARRAEWEKRLEHLEEIESRTAQVPSMLARPDLFAWFSSHASVAFGTILMTALAALGWYDCLHEVGLVASLSFCAHGSLSLTICRRKSRRRSERRVQRVDWSGRSKWWIGLRKSWRR